MKSHAILEEAKNLVEQLEDSRQKTEHISKEHAFIKALLVEKNKKIFEQQQKTEELTRLLIMADKMLSEMKEKLYNKEEKSTRLSEKLTTIADSQDKTFNELKRIIDLRNEQIKSLLRERVLLQNRIVAVSNAYSSAKKQLRDTTEKLNETAKKVSSEADRSKLEGLKDAISRKEREVQSISKVFSDSHGKIKELEEKNRKITLEHEQEKEVLIRMVDRREEEIKKLRELAKETEIKKQPPKMDKVRVTVPKTFDPLERREIESMIRIAVSHGDTISKIKESLVNAGYDPKIIDSMIN